MGNRDFMRNLRLRFWLLALDVAAALGLFGTGVYYWLVARASDATDWGPGAECGKGAPF